MNPKIYQFVAIRGSSGRSGMPPLRKISAIERKPNVGIRFSDTYETSVYKYSGCHVTQTIKTSTVLNTDLKFQNREKNS